MKLSQRVRIVGRRDVVIAGVGAIRQRIIGQQLDGDRVEPAGGNLVAREGRLAVKGSVTAQPSTSELNDFEKIARPFQQRRHVGDEVCPCAACSSPN